MESLKSSFVAATAVDKFDTLYINTPWNKLSMDELAELPLSDLCKDNASLYMWTDSSKICDAAKLIESWGFKFSTVASILNLAEKPSPASVAAPSAQVKQEEVAAPEPDASAPAASVDASASAAAEEATVTAAPSKPRGPRVKSIQPPSWWGDVSSISRPTTEQLWVAVKGEGAALNPKFKVHPYQIIDLPELAKSKARARQPSPWCPAEWSFRRPSEFLKMVTSSSAPDARILELFGDSLHDSVHALGPAIPTLYVPALASDEGSVNVAKNALEDHGKVALRSLAAKLRKLAAPPAVPKEGTEPSATEPATEPAAVEEQDGTVTAVFEKASAAASTNWADSIDLKRVMSSVADYKLAHHHSRSRKVKRASRGNLNADGTERKRYGIAAATQVAPELCEFLGMPVGTPIARTMVGKLINEYIEEHKLKNGRVIELDDPLKKLLKPAPDQVVSYFSICKLLNPLFPKKKAVAEPEGAPDAKKQKVEASA